MSEKLILFGAGAAGRYALSHLRSQDIEPLCFVDNDEKKWRGKDHGLLIMRPEAALQYHPDATWVATAISRPAATEIRAQLKAMGVKTKPLWECLPVYHGLPPIDADATIRNLVADDESFVEFLDQQDFRRNPDYDAQRPPSDCKDIYFPDFITHRDDEHFVDCGAADGDTVDAFLRHWNLYEMVTVFEPDRQNYEAFAKRNFGEWVDERWAAVSDHTGSAVFASTGDFSAHLSTDGGDRVPLAMLDTALRIPPTYIKMDIEGSELEALWGARRILKEHSPVLAICAYHTSDHLWQIPLLIHAIQPEYRLFLRRYAEGAFEIVWYAVPPDRVKK